MNIEKSILNYINRLGRCSQQVAFRTSSESEIFLGSEVLLMSCIKLLALTERTASLIDIVCNDYLTYNNKKRFEINYKFRVYKLGITFRFRYFIGSYKSIKSITSYFKSANWLEREVWDMYGILIEKHPDLRRLLSDYGFEGYPLRKDFPLSGYTEVGFDITKNCVVIRPLTDLQEYRFFDFETAWSQKLVKYK